MNIALQILAGDTKVISYRKELNKTTKSVTATILLQQLIHRFTNNNNKPFYKFIEPCDNDLYVAGDSWTEELGFSKYEFRTAYKKLEDLGLVSRKTNMLRVTYYRLDLVILSKLILSTYGEVDCQPMGVDNVNIVPIAEITTKSTTESIVQKPTFKEFINLLVSDFREKKIYTFANKINQVDATKEAFKYLDDLQVLEVVNSFTNYVIRNKNMASRLDKFMVAYQEGNLASMEHGNNSFDKNKPQQGSIGSVMQEVNKIPDEVDESFYVDYDDE